VGTRDARYAPVMIETIRAALRTAADGSGL